MRIVKGKPVKTGFVALLAVVSLLAVTAMPAMAVAVGAGAGAGTGWEYPQWPETQPETCPPLPIPVLPGIVNGDKFVLRHTGTFSALSTDGGTPIAVYVGPTEVTIDVGQHVISPEGVGPSCDLPIGLVPVQNATVTEVPGSFTPGNVTCNDVPGGISSYTRRAAEVVAFVLELDCNIKGNEPPFVAQVNNLRTYMVIEGTMTPCFTPFTGDTENPECLLDPYRPPLGPEYGSHLITAYEAGGTDILPPSG